MSEEYNPNSRKYFDPKYGMTFNNKCPECGADTWQQEATHTQSEGHAYFYSNENKVVGVIRGVIDTSVKKGVYCGPCDLKLFPHKRGHNNGRKPSE